MRNQWLAIALVLAVAFGTAAVTGLRTQAGAAQKVTVDGGWRYSDGYWNYYDQDDRAWYYTDGRHWYNYGNNDSWSVYNFDKNFGKKYGREGYVAPKSGPDLVVPRHRITVRVP